MISAQNRYVALGVAVYLVTGAWTIGSEFATLNDAPGGIAYRFHARDLNLVLAARSRGGSIRFRVKIDGDRMYQIVRQARPVEDRTFEIEFLNAGVRAYVFTFG